MNKANEKKSILIIGSNGRLGKTLCSEYKKLGFRVHGLGRKELDLTKLENFEKILSQIDFDLLISSAALTLVDEAEDQKKAAKLINELAPEKLAQICQKRGARMLHISTDYVLDGENPGLKIENDPVNALGVLC